MKLPKLGFYDMISGLAPHLADPDQGSRPKTWFPQCLKSCAKSFSSDRSSSRKLMISASEGLAPSMHIVGCLADPAENLSGGGICGKIGPGRDGSRTQDQATG